MKRKVLALILVMTLTCSSALIVSAEEEARGEENSIGGISENIDGSDKSTKFDENSDVIVSSNETKAEENSDDKKFDENSEENSSADKLETVEGNLSNIEKDETEKDSKSSSTEVRDEDVYKNQTTENNYDDNYEELLKGDADKDGYWDSDVAVINNLIENNGLDWEKDAPEKWDETEEGGIRWHGKDVSGLGKRITLIAFEDDSLSGDVDLSGLSELEYLECDYNSNLTGLNLQGCEKLEELSCVYSGLIKLDIRNLTSLSWIQIWGNKLSELNLEGCSSLYYIDCSENNLEEIEGLSGLNISSLDCDWNNIKSLDVSGLKNLSSLSCYDNSMEELNVSGLTELSTLSCSDNLLTELNLSGLTSLTSLSCSGNLLTSLDMNGLTKLSFGRMTCAENPLNTLIMPAGNVIELSSTTGGYINVVFCPYAFSWGETGVQNQEGAVVGLVPTADDGYEFKSWNSLPQNVLQANWWSGPNDGVAVNGWAFIDNGKNITLSANFGPISKYSIIDGAGSSWTEDTTGSITMRADGEFDKFQSVQVDGVTVDPTYYTAQQGSTIITLKPEFLQTLAAGTHTLAILFTDGAASADFTVKEVQEENPGNQSGEGQNPGEDTKPGEGQQPGEEAKPGDEQQNTETNEGNNGQQISGIDKNGNGGQNAGQSGNKTNTTVTKAEKTQEVSKAVKTGDESNVVMFAVVMIVALMVCVVTGGIKIKKRH